jgi:hypothetical protein
MATPLVVTAPLVIATDTTGQMHHLYAGAPVGDAFSEDERKRLREADMIGPADGGEADSQQDKAPKGNASRDEWAKYAADKGAPEDETKPVDEGGLSQSALRDKYGK